MTQRVFVTIAGISGGFVETPPRSNVMVVNSFGNYWDYAAETQQGMWLNVDMSPDATVRQITNAIVTATINNQPSGFNLQERDVILTKIDNG